MKQHTFKNSIEFSDHVRNASDLARLCSRHESMANRYFSILNAGTHIRSALPDLEGRRGLLWRYSYSIASALAVIGLSLLAWPRGRVRQDYGQQCDVLIVSHLVSGDHLDSARDFYFGSLPLDLSKVGFKTVTVLANHINIGPKTAKHARAGVVVLNGWLSPLAEMTNAMRLILRSFSIPVNQGAKPEARRFAWLARAAAFDHRALGYLRVHDQLEQAIKALKPSAILHTLEGHGWERMLAQTAHAQDWPIQVIGYSHTALFPAPRALDLRQGHGRDPDHVLFPGTVTAEMFRKESEFKPEQIAVLGSPKFHNKAKGPKRSSPSKANCCLIAAQGEMSEIETMASAMTEVARMLPNIDFVFRLHPLVSPEKARASIQTLRNPPENFTISTSSLDHDLDSARWLVYRGSSVVLNGLERGIKPIYLNTDGRQRYNDPIPSEITFRGIADTVGQMVEIIKKDSVKPVTSASKEQQAAQTFAREYFTPLNPSALVAILKRGNSKKGRGK